jgi:hypothetical protein
MQEGLLGLVVVMLLAVTAITMIVNRDWRWALAALGLQYFLVFLLITPSWPLELAAVKLVTGWMAGSIFGYTRISANLEASSERSRLPSSAAFQGLAAGLVVLVVLASAPRLADLTNDISINQAWGGLLLIGLGLLQVGLSPSPFRIILGLLTLFSGFEILYAAVEASTLVAGLLAVVNLGIALVGSYLLLAPGMEQEE